MKRALILVLVLLTTATRLALAAPPPPTSEAAIKKPPVSKIPPPIHWLTSWQQIYDYARRHELPILIVFWTKWSPLDKAMQPVWKTPQIRNLASHFIMARLDAETEWAVANRFKVEGYPTVLTLYHSKELDRDVGNIPPTEAARLMQRSLQKYDKIRKANAAQ